MNRSIWIGFDPRERDAFEVCVHSIRRFNPHVPIFAVDLSVLRRRGLYQRPTERRDGKLFDVLSDAPMSTEFAISRFLVPELATNFDLALFMDCDMLVRCDIGELFNLADETKALQVVKHSYEPGETVKMDGQPQTSYPRKNWSSVMLFNRNHPALKTLTLAKINTWTGRALHGFNWLADEFIGELGPEWNHLVGVYGPNPDAKIAHFTLGVPSMDGYATCEHAGEWWSLRPPRSHGEVRLPCPANLH